MYIVTGGAGFIGSNVVRLLNARNENKVLVVDNLTQASKFKNLLGCSIDDYLDKIDFLAQIEQGAFNTHPIKAIFHLGACSDTTEHNGHYMMQNNYRYSVALFAFCQARRIPLIYASSAATYGGGIQFKESLENEAPLNIYGYSKYLFDQYVRQHRQAHTQVVGLRYFNVYGPHEQHKGRMASVAYHHFQQFKQNQQVSLFGEWDGWKSGEQSRDFVYVKDAAKVNLHFLDHPEISGIFNVGTGKAQSFNTLSMSVINAIRAHRQQAPYSLDAICQTKLIRYIDFPDDLKNKYQSFTEADISHLRTHGQYDLAFQSVEEGVADYVKFLIKTEGLSS